MITKSIRGWGKLFQILGKALESSNSWRTKALKSFSISKSGMQGGEAKRNLPWSILDDSHVSHFWSTSWSPIYACYMSFRSSGSQQSNASNGVWFGVEMKELQPLQADHSKLKEEFCTTAKWFRSHFAQCTGVLLKLPDICAPTLLDLFFRYFCINFHSSPCNPPIIGFLSY